MRTVFICLSALLIVSCSLEGPAEINESPVKLESGQKVVFYKFYADWCPPCKKQAPIVEAISKEYPNIEFVHVDTDKDPELAAKYNVQSIPTMVITVDDKQTDYLQGLHSHEDLKKVLNRYQQDSTKKESD